MKINPDGSLEGTPEELAAYRVAMERWQDPRTGLPTVVFQFPTPEPYKPQEPPQSDMPWSRQGCESCRNGGVCGCVLVGPGVGLGVS